MAVYLDHHATTPLDARVLDAMMPYLTDAYGNPSSQSHRWGWQAEAAVEHARERLAGTLAAVPDELVFTSGATESNNMLILGLLQKRARKGNHLITCTTEHRSVVDVAERWRTLGGAVTYLDVDSNGLIDPQHLAQACRQETVLISVMYANNEIGVVQPIDLLAEIAHERGIAFHCDGVQAYGKLSVDWSHVDMISLSAHKLYGPKGVGVAVIRRRPNVRIMAQQVGGGQENGRRAGTLNVAGIVGFAEAAELAFDEVGQESKRLGELRTRLWQGLKSIYPKAIINGHQSLRLPGNLNVSFMGIPSAKILLEAHDIALSAGSACSSGTGEPSHVIRALSSDPERAQCAIRFGLGRSTSETDINQTLERFSKLISKLT